MAENRFAKYTTPADTSGNRFSKYVSPPQAEETASPKKEDSFLDKIEGAVNTVSQVVGKAKNEFVKNIQSPFSNLVKNVDENTPAGQAKQAAEYLDLPFKALTGAGIASGMDIGAAIKNLREGNYGTAALHGGKAIGEAGLGLLNVLPATALSMAAFNVGGKAIEEASPTAGKVIENAMNPFSKMLELSEKRGQKLEGWEKPAAGLADVAYQFMLFTVGHNTAKSIGIKIAGGEKLSPEEHKIVQESLPKEEAQKVEAQAETPKVASPETTPVKTPELSGLPKLDLETGQPATEIPKEVVEKSAKTASSQKAMANYSDLIDPDKATTPKIIGELKKVLGDDKFGEVAQKFRDEYTQQHPESSPELRGSDYELFSRNLLKEINDYNSLTPDAQKELLQTLRSADATTSAASTSEIGLESSKSTGLPEKGFQSPEEASKNIAGLPSDIGATSINPPSGSVLNSDIAESPISDINKIQNVSEKSKGFVIPENVGGVTGEAYKRYTDIKSPEDALKLMDRHSELSKKLIDMSESGDKEGARKIVNGIEENPQLPKEMVETWLNSLHDRPVDFTMFPKDIRAELEGMVKNKSVPEESGLKPPSTTIPVASEESTQPKETVGIRQESLGQRFEGKIQPGKGASTEELVKQGQELYKTGKVDADAIGTKVKAGQGINAQEMGVLRAKAADLAKQSNDAQALADKDPNLQEAADKAFNAETEWVQNNLKPAETEWNKMGMVMQGETDIDTGTLVGLRRAVQQQHGRDLKPEEVSKAREIAREVTRLNKEIDASQKKLQGEISKPRTKKELTPEQQKNKNIWTHAKENYIDKGVGFEDMIRGVSQDLNLSHGEVAKALTEPKSARVASRETLRLMSLRRQAIQNAKSWIRGVNTPAYSRAIQAILRVPFSIATLGHAVVMETHAGQHIFMPSTWKNYWTNVGNQFHYWGSRAYHEQMMQELEQHPNFYFWKKAGLAIDPNQVYDPYQAYSKWLGKLGEPGKRSMDAVKTFRIADAEAIWDKTPQSMKTGDYAKEVANVVNHQSGLGKIGTGPVPEGIDMLAFAARLEASRWARIIGDPVKALATYTRWSKATDIEKASANLVTKRSAEFVGVYFASLIANEGLNMALGSKNNVNFTDPKKSDFLRFKIGSMSVDPTGGMTTPVRFLSNVLVTSLGVAPKRGGRFNTIVDLTGHYVRGKESPAAGILTDIGMRADFSGKPLPNASEQEKSKRPPYTWSEYFLEEHGPIALSGATKEIADVWKSQGMSNTQVQDYLKALAILGFESTGIRAAYPPPPKSKGGDVTSPTYQNEKYRDKY
jgi:hypothetical protein